MLRFLTFAALLPLLLLSRSTGYCQQSIGIGTTTPDQKAALDISSTQKGVLLPRLTAPQQATLAAILTPAQAGMLVTDATTGKLITWSGSVFQPTATANPLTAKAPLSVTTNTVSINPGTAKGDLITWDGNNWVNKQPAPQHFSFTQDNLQPYLAVNYCISLFGIFPSRADASAPFVGEIFIVGCNFTINGYALCDGQLLPISGYETLFNLIGTTYGGDGQTTFAVPDMRGRVAIDQGNSSGTSNYIIGQTGGAEQKTIAH
jgi:microcystin-dependent protein